MKAKKAYFFSFFLITKKLLLSTILSNLLFFQVEVFRSEMERLKKTENETIELTDYEESQNQPHHVSEMEPVKQVSSVF